MSELDFEEEYGNLDIIQDFPADYLPDYESPGVIARLGVTNDPVTNQSMVVVANRRFSVFIRKPSSIQVVHSPGAGVFSLHIQEVGSGGGTMIRIVNGSCVRLTELFHQDLISLLMRESIV